FAHTGCSERKERQPKQKKKVRTQNAATDLVCGLEQMMMIIPIDAEINEAKHVTQQYRQHWFQRGKVDGMRHLQFQHHDCDDDGKDSVAERFETACFHPASR